MRQLLGMGKSIINWGHGGAKVVEYESKLPMGARGRRGKSGLVGDGDEERRGSWTVQDCFGGKKTLRMENSIECGPGGKPTPRSWNLGRQIGGKKKVAGCKP